LFLQPMFQKLGLLQPWCHWVWLDSSSLDEDLLSMLVNSTGNCQVVFLHWQLSSNGSPCEFFATPKAE
jgi:hypothetical protein